VLETSIQNAILNLENISKSQTRLCGKSSCVIGFKTEYDSALSDKILENLHVLMDQYKYSHNRHEHVETIFVFVPRAQMGVFNNGLDIRFTYNHDQRILSLNVSPRLRRYVVE